jgi:hypothetical protein
MSAGIGCPPPSKPGGDRNRTGCRREHARINFLIYWEMPWALLPALTTTDDFKGELFLNAAPFCFFGFDLDLSL